MTLTEILQAVNMGGVLAFAAVVLMELRSMRKSLELMAARMNYEAGRSDATPAEGTRLPRTLPRPGTRTHPSDR